MKTGTKILIIVIILIAIAALGYIIYKVVKSGPATQQNPNTLPQTGYQGTGSGSASGSGSGSNNPPPPPPAPNPSDNIGKVAVSNNIAVDVYYQSPFSLFKTTTYKGEYIGTVTGVSGAYYVINDGYPQPKLVMQKYVNFL